jgi:hypothetical protein
LWRPASEVGRALLEFLNRFFEFFNIRLGAGEELVQKGGQLFGVAETVRPVGLLLARSRYTCLLRLRVLGQKGEDLEDTKTNRERKYPVEFESATAQGDVVDITLPKGFKVDELPAPMQLSIGPASYKSKAEITNQGIHYVRLYQIDDVHLPLARVSELKQFYRQIGTDERSVAVLKQLAP